MNQELIKRFALGEIVYQHTGTIEQWHEIMNAAKIGDIKPFVYDMLFYCNQVYSNVWQYYTKEDQRRHPNLPIFTTEQFFEDETEHLPDVRQTMDAETRELAKQLLIHNDNFTQEECIELAKDFIQLLNEQ